MKESFSVPYVEIFQCCELFEPLEQALALVGFHTSAPPSALGHNSATGWPGFYYTSPGSERQGGRLPEA